MRRRTIWSIGVMAVSVVALAVASAAFGGAADDDGAHPDGAGDQRGDRRGRGGRGNAEAEALAEPFKGVTTDGNVVGGLYSIKATGVSTAPVTDAAEAFLASLTEAQRAATTFAIDDDEWRKWQNVHRYDRQGVSLRDMSPEQEHRALDMLRAGLSATGFEKARNIMTLNGVLAELVGNQDEYGEDLYFFTVLGTPSSTEPWGWQLDGHHLVINYLVIGDQVVMTPTFMGSEPVRAETGPHAGLRVFGPEETKGLAMIRTLDPGQQEAATIADEPIRQVLTPAFRDNFELRYEGLRADWMNADQRDVLLELVEEYVGNMDDGHAEVRMAEIREHLNETYFAWMGGTTQDAVFYYRVHSPVLLLEFDHQGGIALNRGQGMSRNHIHTVIRTPNGNDYGKDLLRRHHEEFDHVNGRHVRRSEPEGQRHS